MRSSLSFLLAVLVLSCVPSVHGSEPAAATGSLAGTVRTSDGAALPHVAVSLHGNAGSARVMTGPDGAFRVPRLALGEYSASVDAPGLTLTGPSTASVGGGPARLDLVLSAAPVREHVVVSATRGEATSSTLGAAVDVLERERIEERAAPSLLALVQELPGVATARAGGTGLQGSVFIRGGESRYARVLVDGVAVNQPGGAFDFGTALPFEIERVEVTRGAASSLYGSDALAGVVSVTTRRATGEGPSLRVEGDAGGFGWRRVAAATTGTHGVLDWNVGAQRLATDNAQPNSAFDETSVALSTGVRLGPTMDARAVLRFDDGRVGTPGPSAFGRPDLDASFERRDLLASGSLRRVGPRLSHELRIGFARTRQLSLDPLDSGPWTPEWQGRSGSFELSDFPQPAGFQNRSERALLSYQLELPLGARQLLTAGAEADRETGAIGDRSQPLLRPERTSLGLYVQDRVLLGSRAYLTAGARVERNGSYGTRVVPRAALALRLRAGEDATTLRASAGMGIKEPSFLESYGESLYARGNPDLDPERSTTVDLGIEQRLLSSRVRAAVTAFHHAYRDQIAYTVLDFTTYAGSYVNLARTRSRGLEVAIEARPVKAVWFAGQYTYQDGKILESPSDFDPAYAVDEPLLRRPRHQGSLSGGVRFGRASLGATLVHVGARSDSDFVGLGLKRNDAYTRLDARARVSVFGPLEAFVVAENLTDASYQEVLGYPALGRSLRAGLRLAVGGRRDAPETR
jgi:outer membrane cobalamin receptor